MCLAVGFRLVIWLLGNAFIGPFPGITVVEVRKLTVTKAPPLDPRELGLDALPYVGVIGGSGLYEAGFFSEYFEVQLHTPYGLPSDNVVIGRVGNEWVAFLPSMAVGIDTRRTGSRIGPMPGPCGPLR